MVAPPSHHLARDSTDEAPGAAAASLRDRVIPGKPPTGTLAGLLFGLAMAVLLPALLLAVAVAWQAVEGQRAMVEARMRDMARALAFSVDREVAGAGAALEGLATSPAFLPDPAAPDIAALTVQARRLSERLVARIGLISRDGRLLLATGLGPAEPLPRVRSHGTVDRAIATGETVVGDLVTSPFSGRPVLPVAVPVRRQDGSCRVRIRGPEQHRRTQPGVSVVGQQRTVRDQILRAHPGARDQ